MKNIRKTVIRVGTRHASIRRRRIQCVSSARFPYQITRYCPKVRYPQNAEKAKHNFPRSWKCFSSIKSYLPRERRHASTIRVQLASAVTHPPMKNHPPYIVLWKCGSSDIDKSHDSTIQPNANAKPRKTASRPWSE